MRTLYKLFGFQTRVNNLPADHTFPSQKLFMGTVKFIIDHGTFGKDLHSYTDQNHKIIANSLPTTEEKQKFKIIF